MAMNIGRMTNWDEKPTKACFLYMTVVHLITESVIKDAARQTRGGSCK